LEGPREGPQEKRIGEGAKRADRLPPELGERAVRHPELEGFGTEAHPAAVGARLVAAVAREQDAHVHLVLLPLETLEEAAHTAEAGSSLEDEPSLARRELFVRLVDRD